MERCFAIAQHDVMTGEWVAFMLAGLIWQQKYLARLGMTD
jgi:hypothetical protein